MENTKNKKSFIEKHPVFGSLLLLAAYAIEYGTPRLKQSLNEKKDNAINKLFRTKEKFLGTPNYKLHKLIDNATNPSSKTTEEHVLQEYQKIDKVNTDPELMILLYKKCVLGNKFPQVAVKMLDDLNPLHYEEALNAALRNGSIDTISHMFKDPKFNKPLKLNHMETVTQLLTRSVRYDQEISIDYMLEHTRAFTALTDAPNVHKLLSICEKEELTKSLKALNKYDLNLLNCETLVQSNFFTTNAPSLANDALQQKLQHVIPAKKVAPKKKI